MLDLIPLAKRGDVSFRIGDKEFVLRLTPTACAMIEENTGAESYMDALTSFIRPSEFVEVTDSTGKTSQQERMRISAKLTTGIMKALLAANGHDAALSDEIEPTDAAVLIVQLMRAHSRPGGETDPPKAAGIA